MADAEGFEFGEEGFHAVLVEVVDASAAVGGDDFEVVGEGFEETGYERASAGLEELEDADLVIEAFSGEVAAEDLVDLAVVADADGSALGVFDLVHGGGWVRSGERRWRDGRR